MVQPESAYRALAQTGRLCAVEREAQGLINGKDRTTGRGRTGTGRGRTGTGRVRNSGISSLGRC